MVLCTEFDFTAVPNITSVPLLFVKFRLFLALNLLQSLWVSGRGKRILVLVFMHFLVHVLELDENLNSDPFIFSKHYFKYLPWLVMYSLKSVGRRNG